jgi:hypothetical protein
LGAVGANVPSLCNFLEILLGLGPEYGFDDAGEFSPSHKCFFIDDRTNANTAPELTHPDLSPTSHVIYLKEKAKRLQARQANLDAAQVELETRREEMEQ